jgi:hypothetical protein
MIHEDAVKATYETLMAQSKLIVERKIADTERNPTEEQYAVLHMTVENTSGRNLERPADLSLTQQGIIRFVSVVSQIVAGWGGKLIEANHHSYTAIFPISESDAGSHSCICGVQILNAVSNVINPSLKEEGIDMKFECGIGISMGAVYDFPTGLKLPANNLYYGEAMASAAEYANMTTGVVIVDKVVKERFEREDSPFKVQFQPYRYHEWVGYQFIVS